MHRGYWRVWRKWEDHPVSRDANAWLVMSHLCNAACVVPSKSRRIGYDLAIGECDLTREQLCIKTSLKDKAVRKALERLQSWETITKRLVSGGQRGRNRAVYNISNFAEYNMAANAEGPKKGRPKGRKRATEGPVLQHEQHVQHVQEEPLLGDASPEAAEPPEFTAWYEQYPKKGDRQAALSRWKRLPKAARYAALDAIPRFAAVWAGAETKELCKCAAAWLKAGSWDFDEAEERRKTLGKNPQAQKKFGSIGGLVTGDNAASWLEGKAS